jgi:membrane-associated phospholipid phosphatase
VLSATWFVAATIALQQPPVQPAPTAWPDDRPLTRLVQNLGHDLAALPGTDTLFWLGVGGAGAMAAHPVDDNLAAWADGADPGYASVGGTLGDGFVIAGAALGTYAVGRVAGHAPTAHIGGDLIRAQVLNGLLTRGLKLIVARDRPSGGGHAFPSGHSSASFAAAAVLAEHFGWKAGLAAYATAGFIGWTRVHDRAHWLSDAVFGAAIGAVVGRTVTRGHRARTWTIVPAGTSGGFAVFVVRR